MVEMDCLYISVNIKSRAESRCVWRFLYEVVGAQLTIPRNLQMTKYIVSFCMTVWRLTQNIQCSARRTMQYGVSYTHTLFVLKYKVFWFILNQSVLNLTKLQKREIFKYQMRIIISIMKYIFIVYLFDMLYANIFSINLFKFRLL